MARPTKIKWVLDDLCSRLGFCLPHDERARIEQNPPRDIEAFTDAIFVAEGMDPHDKSNRGLRQQVRKLIVKHLKPKEESNAI
jgi:hypothetical protein